MKGPASWLIRLAGSQEKIGHWLRQDLEDLARETKVLQGLSDEEIEDRLKKKLNELDNAKYYGDSDNKALVQAIPFIKELWKHMAAPVKEEVPEEEVPEVVDSEVEPVAEEVKVIETSKKIAKEDQLVKGIRIEEEHSDTVDYIEKVLKETGELPPKKKIYERIAIDHLKENSKYYDYLEEMEKKMKEVQQEQEQLELEEFEEKEDVVGMRKKAQYWKVEIRDWLRSNRNLETWPVDRLVNKAIKIFEIDADRSEVENYISDLLDGEEADSYRGFVVGDKVKAKEDLVGNSWIVEKETLGVVTEVGDNFLLVKFDKVLPNDVSTPDLKEEFVKVLYGSGIIFEDLGDSTDANDITNIEKVSQLKEAATWTLEDLILKLTKAGKEHFKKSDKIKLDREDIRLFIEGLFDDPEKRKKFDMQHFAIDKEKIVDEVYKKLSDFHYVWRMASHEFKEGDKVKLAYDIKEKGALYSAGLEGTIKTIYKARPGTGEVDDARVILKGYGNKELIVPVDKLDKVEVKLIKGEININDNMIKKSLFDIKNQEAK